MKKVILQSSVACLLLVFMLACAPTQESNQEIAKGTMAQTATKSPTALSTKTVHEGLQVGDIAPDFKLKNVDERYVSLGSFKDVKGYIIVFTCNHCPYAVMYEDRLIELHNTFASKGYPVVAVNPNDPEVVPADSFKEMQVRAAEKKFPFVYLLDEGQKVYPQYGAKKTPHVFLLNKEKEVNYIGAIDDNHEEASAVQEKYLENAILAMEKGETADPSVTKAIGCSIKTVKNPPKKKH